MCYTRHREENDRVCESHLIQLRDFKDIVLGTVFMHCGLDRNFWLFFSAAVSDPEPIQAVRGVKVVDIGVNSFTLSWKKTPGVSGYKISWVPFLGKRIHKNSTQ